mmetsp:Transcript_17185/g.42716  ORF Transcript_17185/g.42716 Transcript_17185/m.42716 type:complete len:329 (-) Transcript_17185:98-1084(-)
MCRGARARRARLAAAAPAGLASRTEEQRAAVARGLGARGGRGLEDEGALRRGLVAEEASRRLVAEERAVVPRALGRRAQHGERRAARAHAARAREGRGRVRAAAMRRAVAGVDTAAVRRVVAPRGEQRSREAQVEDLDDRAAQGSRLAPAGVGQWLREHDVVGLEVAVHGQLRVQVRDGLEHLARDPLRLGLAQCAALVEDPLQRGPVAQLHHEMHHTARLDEGLEQRGDPLDVREPPHEADLAQQVLLELHRVHARAQQRGHVDHLERRHVTRVAALAHAPHGAKASLADRLADARPARRNHLRICLAVDRRPDSLSQSALQAWHRV